MLIVFGRAFFHIAKALSQRSALGTGLQVAGSEYQGTIWALFDSLKRFTMLVAVFGAAFRQTFFKLFQADNGAA